MRLALHGYGKMGHMIDRIARERGHEITASFDRSNVITEEKLADVDAIIDFSNAAAIDDVVRRACAVKVNLVIGTTGWNDKVDAIRETCDASGIGVCHAANFSPGATVLFALARQAAERIARFDGYAAGIEERHHSQKKDAPSGTALRIAKEVREGSGGAIDPQIAATRVGSEVGLHTLFFDSPDDLIELTHRARSREGFARGAVIAAELLRGRSGFFTFEELLEIVRRGDWATGRLGEQG